MKAFFYFLFFGFVLVFAPPVSAQHRSANTPAEVNARNQIITESPIVFLGRPIQGQNFKDERGLIYNSTVIEVLEVLRGHQFLRPGTVELVDSFERQTPELEWGYQMNGIAIPQNMGPVYGIYFCSPSTLPSQKIPYPTSNAPLQLKKFNNDPHALINIRYGLLPGGLYRVWKSQADLREYLKSLPNLRPLTKAINNTEYPPIKYHDTRPGGFDYHAPRAKKARPTIPSDPIKLAPHKTDLLSVPSPSIAPTNLPIDAMRRLPGVMQRLRSGHVLSKDDSVFIRQYLPEYEHRAPPVIRESTRPPKTSRVASPSNSVARLVTADTLLTMAIQNLGLDEPTPLSRALQGELWLKSNQAGLYLDQLYFEMNTTADLKLDSSPFGQTLIGTYTALPGAPRYLFYQSYDAITKNILVAAYPDFINPERVVLPTTQTAPLFRFSYTLPDSIPESPLRTVTFTPLTTPASRQYTNYFLTPNPDYPEIYSPFQFTGQASIPASTKRPRSLQIDSVRVVDASVISAGTGQVVEIFGADFRTLVNPKDPTQRGKVKFVDADTAAGNFLHDIDRKDLISWQDTVIKVTLPSSIQAGYINPRAAGGGRIKVQPYYGKTTQSKPRHSLDIQYSLATIMDTDSSKTTGYLASINCSRGMTFALSSSLTAIPGVKSTVQAALRAWSASTGEEFTLSPVAFVGTRSGNDRVNVIYYDSQLPSGTAMMTHRVSDLFRGSGPGVVDTTLRWATLDIDIAISPATSWAYDTTNVSLCPTGAGACPQDFYASMLHEIGHAIGLQHVVDTQDIMFYALSNNQRLKLTTGRQAAVAGARQMAIESKRVNWFRLGKFGQPLANCTAQNRSSNPFYEAPKAAVESLTLYPNPSSEEATILFPSSHKGSSEYWIKDELGRTVSHGNTDTSQPLKIGKGLLPGFYLVQVRNGTKTTTLRMMKGQ